MGGQSTGDTEHRMVKESIVLQKQRVELSPPCLVVTDTHTVKENLKEYRCSCGESFERAAAAHEHLDDVQSHDTDEEVAE